MFGLFIVVIIAGIAIVYFMLTKKTSGGATDKPLTTKSYTQKGIEYTYTGSLPEKYAPILASREAADQTIRREIADWLFTQRPERKVGGGQRRR